jgi:DNA-binding NarL/FixJ family response regulator
MESKVDHFLHSVREGATAFVLREASASEITEVVCSVIAGYAVCPPCFSAILFRWAAQRLAIRKNLTEGRDSELSRREEQIVELVCWGLTNKEVASRLHLSEHTVRNHVHRILKKTGASDRISLIDRYVEQFPSDRTAEETPVRMIS